MIDTLKIRNRMRTLKMTYDDLSHCCGLSASTLSKIIRNRRETNTVIAALLKTALQLPDEEAADYFFTPLLHFTQQRKKSPASGPEGSPCARSETGLRNYTSLR